MTLDHRTRTSLCYQLKFAACSALHCAGPDVDVRTAAGEAVALLYETCGLADMDGISAPNSGYARCAVWPGAFNIICSWNSCSPGMASPDASLRPDHEGPNRLRIRLALPSRQEVRAHDMSGSPGRSPTEERSDGGQPWQSPASEGGSAGAGAAGLDGVVARMRELATNRGDAARRSRRDRGTLRTKFRDLVGIVEVRVTPSVALKKVPSRCCLRHAARLHIAAAAAAAAGADGVSALA